LAILRLSDAPPSARVTIKNRLPRYRTAAISFGNVGICNTFREDVERLSKALDSFPKIFSRGPSEASMQQSTFPNELQTFDGEYDNLMQLHWSAFVSANESKFEEVRDSRLAALRKEKTQFWGTRDF